METGTEPTAKAKCGLCGLTFDTEAERCQHEWKEHSAEVRPRRQCTPPDQEETAA